MNAVYPSHVFGYCAAQCCRIIGISRTSSSCLLMVTQPQSSANKSGRSPLVQRNGPKVSTNTTLSTKGNIVWTVTAACHFLRLFSPHHFHPETAHLTVVAFNRENETFTESTEMYVYFRMQRTK